MWLPLPSAGFHRHRRPLSALLEACYALREPLDRGAGRRDIELQHELVVRLRREAASREIPVARLIHELLDVIVTDRLTTAILDN